jgi:hypothetical protein
MLDPDSGSAMFRDPARRERNDSSDLSLAALVDRKDPRDMTSAPNASSVIVPLRNARRRPSWTAGRKRYAIAGAALFRAALGTFCPKLSEPSRGFRALACTSCKAHCLPAKFLLAGAPPRGTNRVN